MYTSYTYGKFRHEFGKQCRFSKSSSTVLVNLLPDLNQEELWIPKNPVNKSTNKSVELSEHEVPKYNSLFPSCIRKSTHA